MFFKFPYISRMTPGKPHLLGTCVSPSVENHALTTSDDRKARAKCFELAERKMIA